MPTIFRRSRIEMVGTLRFAHPTRLICFARKRKISDEQTATNRHDGQISQNLVQPLSQKYSAFVLNANQQHNSVRLTAR